MGGAVKAVTKVVKNPLKAIKGAVGGAVAGATGGLPSAGQAAPQAAPAAAVRTVTKTVAPKPVITPQAVISAGGGPSAAMRQDVQSRSMDTARSARSFMRTRKKGPTGAYAGMTQKKATLG